MAKTSLERTLEKQQRENRRIAEQEARRQRAEAIVNGQPFVGGMRLMDAASEEVFKVIIDTYDGNECRIVKGDSDIIPVAYHSSLNLEFEKLKMYGVLSNASVWINGMWEAVLAPQGITYFESKIEAQKKEENETKSNMRTNTKDYDVFISHANKDKSDYVDELYLRHGATLEITDPTTDKIREIEKRGYAVGLKLLRAKVRHLGTEENLRIMTEMSNLLKEHIDMLFKTAVKDIIVENKTVKGIVLENGKEIYADNVILAPGRDGSTWLTKVFKRQGLELYNNQVDIGVRVETSNIVMDEINTNLYEGKFVYNTSVGTKVRTFCSNPSGHVVVENHSGTMLANGHAYHDPKLGSKNTNFALLVSHTFSEPFNEPNEFAHEVSSLANKLSNGSIIVQRYGDIKRGRRTTAKRLKEGYTTPTLPEAVPGDLGLVLPYNTMKSIIEMIEALDHVTPGIANEHTLLYGVEAKFYSARPRIREGFESEIDHLYVAGDGAGLTRGLAQAGANGVLIARHIIEKKK